MIRVKSPTAAIYHRRLFSPYGVDSTVESLHFILMDLNFKIAVCFSTRPNLSGAGERGFRCSVCFHPAWGKEFLIVLLCLHCTVLSRDITTF